MRKENIRRIKPKIFVIMTSLQQEGWANGDNGISGGKDECPGRLPYIHKMSPEALKLFLI